MTDVGNKFLCLEETPFAKSTKIKFNNHVTIIKRKQGKSINDRHFSNIATIVFQMKSITSVI